MPITPPSQVFTHILEPLKGWWQQHALDYVGMIDPAVDPTALPAVAGRAFHVSGNTPFPGGAGRVDSMLQPGAVNTQMAIFLFQNQTDPDVSNNGFGNTDPYGWTGVTAVGWMSGFVAVGAYEVATTEFDQTAGVVYNPNDPLHAPTVSQITGADKSAAGMLFKVKNWPGGGGGPIVPGTDNVCGIVSRGMAINHNRRPVLHFWPVWAYGTENVS